MLQRFVALKIVVTNRRVLDHLKVLEYTLTCKKS